MAQDIYNPETWTEQDRALLDTARQLTTEEMDFMFELMQLVEADPLKSEARSAFAEQHASEYNFRTVEGRKSFLEAMRNI